MLIGGFFRFAYYEQWMHYQLDQARDYKVIAAALEKGPGELPLQGPKAAGNVHIDSDGDGVAEDKTTLRLGPLYYYLSYLSALVFGNSPPGSTMFILIFSLFTIPLFFFFVREFFRENIALALSVLVSVSLFFVIYSRFGWNPNLMPFFSLLTAYSLLQMSKHTSRSGWWLVLCAVSFAFLSHMHFLALVTFGVTALGYLLWVRPRIGWKYWCVAVSAFVFLNIPLILNDVKTNGENAKAFVASIRGESGEEKTTSRVLVTRNILEHAEMAWVVLTGDQNIAVPKVKKAGHVVCEELCKGALPKSLLSLLYIMLGFVSWLWLLKRTKNSDGKNFLRLTGLWALFTFVIYIPLAFELAPRFFLMLAPLFVIFFGFILSTVLYRKNQRNILFLRIIFFILIFSNTFFVGQYFLQLKDAGKNSSFRLPYADLILKEKTRVTLGQLQDVRDRILTDVRANGAPVHIHAQAEYKRAIWERIVEHDDYPFYGVGDLRRVYPQGNYYLLIRSQSDFSNVFKNFVDLYDVEQTEHFGTLTLHTLSVKDNLPEGTLVSTDPVFEKREDPVFSSSAQPRYLWRQIFTGCTYDYASRKCQ